MAATVAVLLVAMAGPATARDRVTYGDVRAHFQAAESAGALIFERGEPNLFHSAPANLFAHSLRPLVFWNNTRYCELDWQLVVLALLEEKKDKGILKTASVTFEVDGSATAMPKSTAIKPYLGTFVQLPEPAVWRQWGVFYAPGDLEARVAPNTLSAVAHFPDFGDFPLPALDFFIDEAGTGACL